MTKKLQLLISCFLLFCALVLSTDGYSQINYSQNFDEDEGGWTSGDFYSSDYIPCDGMSLTGEFYFVDFGGGDIVSGSSTTVSPLLGLSSGLPVTLNYSFKVYNYWDDIPLSDEFDWGTVTISYGTSPSGPWTVISTLDSGNTTSSDCTAQTATFTPASGTNVYLKVTGEPGTVNFTDVLVVLDDITAVQDVLDCTGAPDASAAIALNGPVCNQQFALLGLSPAYGAAGLTYQWQSSVDGITYNDIEGATASTYATITSEELWYRVNITCTASETTTTSEAVQPEYSGDSCTLCGIEFEESVEPITLVNFASINNETSAALDGTPSVQDFTELGAATVYKGQTYTITVKGNSGGNYDNYYKAYIDFNRNGVLNDAGEVFEIGVITNSTGSDSKQATASIMIPEGAASGETFMRVFKLYDEYSENPCGSDYEYGQVEDYLLNVLECTTVAPNADAAQTFCQGATVADLVTDGTAVKWYTAATEGTLIPATQVLVDGNVYYGSQTVGCESADRVEVTAGITVVEADDPDDVTACESYILPELTAGTYYNEPSAGGTEFAAGDEITETVTLYVYAENGDCTKDNSFVVTINHPVADALDDVTVCDSYTLPALTNGTYHTEPGGEGDVIAAGSSVTETTTLYVFSGTATCSAENSFMITVNSAQADNPDDVIACESYILPELTAGTYYTESGAGGDVVDAGTEITETTTLYVYAENGDCTKDNEFTITIGTPIADDPEDVTACSSYTLPVLTNGAYYLQAGGGGNVIVPGTQINETTTIYVYSSFGTCSIDNAFTVTIFNAVADAPENVINCGAYTLPELSNGDYYTAANGGGELLSAGDEITENATIYVYAEDGDVNTTCTDEHSFTVTINNFVVDELEDITVCSSYILSELENGMYYTEASGDGDMLMAGDEITETATIYIFNGTSTCNAESSFVVTVVNLEADELEDVTVYCNGYTLPELMEGNNYYTAEGGLGEPLFAGDVITQSGTIYIYAQGTNPACTAETSFEITVDEVDVPTGDDQISIEANIGGLPSLYSIEVEAEGTVTWYATEDDAENGVNPLSEDFIVGTGSNTYYATQTIDGCESEPFAVTIDVIILGSVDFDIAAFKYYPNPTADVLNLSYSKNITAIEIYNLMGQQVMKKEINQADTKIDISSLASGTYMLKVHADNASTIIKVVKNK